MGYCVLHCEKGKEGAALGNHIDRTEGKEYSFRSADSEKRNLNQEFCLPHFRELSMMEGIEKRISEGYTGQTAIRKDAVRFVETIFSGSADAMVRIQQDKKLFEQWKKETIATAHKLFGEENIVRMSLHMDEKTPHFHCVAVPLVDGRLSAKTLLTRQNLSNFQDEYAQAMKPFGLNRGELGSDAVHNGLTEHLANVSREQKNQASNLANEMARLQNEHAKLSNEFKALEQKKEKLKAKETALEEKEDKINSTEKDLTSRIRQYNQSLEGYKEALEELESKEEDLEQKEAELDTKLNEVDNLVTKVIEERKKALESENLQRLALIEDKQLKLITSKLSEIDREAKAKGLKKVEDLTVKGFTGVDYKQSYMKLKDELESRAIYQQDHRGTADLLQKVQKEADSKNIQIEKLRSELEQTTEQSTKRLNYIHKVLDDPQFYQQAKTNREENKRKAQEVEQSKNQSKSRGRGI